MVRQMLRKVRVMDPGDTDLLPGTLMDISDFTDANKDIVISGGVLQHLVQSFLVLRKPHLKQIHSCQRLPSKKQHCKHRCSYPW